MAKQPGDNFPGLKPLVGDLYFQIGNGVFSTTDSEATIRTQLDTIEAGFANVNDTISEATDFTGSETLHVGLAPSSGAVTVTRSSGGTSGATFFYLLIGKKYTASTV